jgi:hypothetical protein
MTPDALITSEREETTEATNHVPPVHLEMPT